MSRIATLCLFLFLLSAWTAQAQQVAEIVATKDNTLYEDASGLSSNGSGQQLFAGKTARNEIRRALVAFDLAGAIPDGAVIDSVQVQLTMNKSLGSRHNVHLHRVTQEWGEGSSDAGGQEGDGTTAVDGDATWIHAIRPGTNWNNAGGDFLSLESASIPIQATGAAIWYSTQELVDDVNHWLSTPAENFGWLVMGDEVASRTAQRFASRGHADFTARPLLRIFYSSTATFTETEDLPGDFQLESAWPNPFGSSVSLQLFTERPETVQVDVYDLQGRRITTLQENVRAGEIVLELATASWPIGAYLVRVSGSRHTATKTIIKAR